MDDLAKRLAEPFPEGDLEWRLLRSGLKAGKPWGMVAPYVTARAIAQRLDEVVGPMGWKVSYEQMEWLDGRDGRLFGFLCHLSLAHENQWVSKSDGAPMTEFESFKGGISDAFKRAAVVWGIGRYLYQYSDLWAVFSERGKHSDKIGKGAEGRWFKWDAPPLPTRAPAPTPEQAQAIRDRHPNMADEAERERLIQRLHQRVKDIKDPEVQKGWSVTVEGLVKKSPTAMTKALKMLDEVVAKQDDFDDDIPF